MTRGMRIGFPRDVRIAADSGSYGITGNTAGTNKGYVVQAAQGNYAIVGNNAVLTPAGSSTPSFLASGVPDANFPTGVAADFPLTPYTTGFDPTLHKFQLLTGALPSGITLNQSTGLTYDGIGGISSASGVSFHIADVLNAADADWVRRSTAPGVFRTHTFNTTASLGGGFGAEFGNLTQGANVAPVIDTSIKTFGTGSLRFDALPILGSSMWWTNFSPDYSRQFGSVAGGETFYFQFRYRVSPEIAASYGPKVFLCGTGDTPGNWFSSCTDLEIELNTLNTGSAGYFNMYNACPGSCGGNSVFEFQEPFGPLDFKLQNALDNGAGLPDAQRYCLYSNPISCLKIFNLANTWLTVQVGVTLGPLTTVGGHDWFYESNVKCWIQVGTGAEQIMYDWTGGITNGSLHTNSPPCHGLCAGNTVGSGQRYGKLWFLPYVQALGSNPQPGQIWYDALILSTQKIPAVLA